MVRVFVFLFQAVHAGAGFFFRRAVDGCVAYVLEVAFGYVAEGDQIEVAVKFREEDVAVFSQEARHEAEFSGFLGGYEVAADVVGGGQGLSFFYAAVEAIEEAAV